jgi:hypothetical protein
MTMLPVTAVAGAVTVAVNDVHDPVACADADP